MDTENKQTESVQTEVVPTVETTKPQSPTQTNTTTIVQPKSRKSLWFTCCAVIFVLLLCIGVCVGGGFALFGVGFRAAKQEIVDMVCNPTDANVAAFYKDNTTDGFKSRLSEEEFKRELDDLSGAPCDELEKLKLTNIKYYFDNNWDYSSTTVNGVTTVEFTGTIGGKRVIFRTTKSSSTADPKIDYLDVQ
jgi:hypothetical protein